MILLLHSLFSAFSYCSSSADGDGSPSPDSGVATGSCRPLALAGWHSQQSSSRLGRPAVQQSASGPAADGSSSHGPPGNQPSSSKAQAIVTTPATTRIASGTSIAELRIHMDELARKMKRQEEDARARGAQMQRQARDSADSDSESEEDARARPGGDSEKKQRPEDDARARGAQMQQQLSEQRQQLSEHEQQLSEHEQQLSLLIAMRNSIAARAMFDELRTHLLRPGGRLEEGDGARWNLFVHQLTADSRAAGELVALELEDGDLQLTLYAPRAMQDVGYSVSYLHVSDLGAFGVIDSMVASMQPADQRRRFERLRAAARCAAVAGRAAALLEAWGH